MNSYKCPYCNKELSYKCGFIKHVKFCVLNPENKIPDKYCEYCGEILPKRTVNKFCSRRCAALKNTPGRKHTLETRRKISKGVGGSGIAKEEIRTSKTKTPNEKLEKVCILCGKKNIDGKNYCKQCYNSNRKDLSSYVPPSREICDKAGLTFIGYEKDLLKYFECLYGKLKKEKINGKFFDFSNDYVIIEFTFDQTKGVQDLTKRFSKIVNDKRFKIAYLPFTNLGNLRKKRLQDLNVEIRNSMKYSWIKNKYY